jgi:hypothetical protein
LRRVGKPCKDARFNRTSGTTPSIGGRCTPGNCALAMSKTGKDAQTTALTVGGGRVQDWRMSL